MILYIKKWTAHYNQILYSLLYYSELRNLSFSIKHSIDVPSNGMILHFNKKCCFFDYSDDTKYLENPKKFDFYFKRSLTDNMPFDNVFPLNFQANFSYKPLKLISKLPFNLIKGKSSRVELIRALDCFSILTNDSHASKKINYFEKEIKDNNGRIIFITRLWDPDRNNNYEEKQRRIKQNEFRINACRIISKYFKNSITGIYPDLFAKKIAKDVLIDIKKTSKENYLSELKMADICIADDGLKDTPGWKIAEYIMFGKAIVSTPINVVIKDFKKNINYKETYDRTDYKCLPDIITSLIKDKKYLEMKKNNKEWYNNHLRPDSYIENILKVISN